jgi:hypothetical protein
VLGNFGNSCGYGVCGDIRCGRQRASYATSWMKPLPVSSPESK